MIKSYVVIKNVRIVDTAKKMFTLCDILLGEETDRGRMFITSGKLGSDGRFSCVETGQDIFISMYDGLSIQNARSKLFAPAFVDLDCRLGINTSTGEDIISSTMSARNGGWGHILPAPELPMATFHKHTTRPFLCQVTPVGGLDDIGNANLTAISDACDPYASADDQRRIMSSCLERDILYICGRMDDSLVGQSRVNLGRVSRMLGTVGIPQSAETIAVARAALLAAEVGCRVHITTVSCRATLDVIRWAKSRGARITCGTTPLYFSLCEDDVMLHGGSAIVYPPLRSHDDRDAIIEGLLDGTIDCISSGHAPVSRGAKGNTADTADFGAVGFETAFSVCATYLIQPRHMDVFRLIDLLSINPGRILGQETALQQGKLVRCNMISTDSEVVYSRNNLHSRCYNTPFFGRPLVGTIDQIY